MQFKKSIILLILLFIIKWNKEKASCLVIPSITQQIQPFPSEFDKTPVYGAFHKSFKSLSDWPETLTLSCELPKPGFDWLSRPQTTVETSDNRIQREASPRKSFVFSFVFPSVTCVATEELFSVGKNVGTNDRRQHRCHPGTIVLALISGPKPILQWFWEFCCHWSSSSSFISHF